MPTTTEMSARNPLTGVEDYRFPVDSREAVAAACGAVRAAQPAWQALGVEGRAAALRALGAAFEAQAADLVAALSADTGRHRIALIEVAAVQGFIALAIANASAGVRRRPRDRDAGVDPRHRRPSPAGALSRWSA